MTHRQGSVWAWIAIAVPVVIFALIWSYYAVNIPKWDDHALRHFLYLFDQETTLSGKIYQVFKQHNEHRIVYDRLITLLDYHLFGELNFRHLMVAGNLSLVGLLAVFVAVLRWEIGTVSRQPVLYAVPVAGLLFNLSQWENMFWGMAALQNFSVVLWVLISFYWLTYTNRRGLALIAAVLATLTSGNGLLVWPVGFVLLALRVAESTATTDRSAATARPQRAQTLRWLGGWTLVAVVVITLYFIGFEKPAGNPPVRGSAADLLKGWLAFIGAAAEALPTTIPFVVSVLLGGLITLLTGFFLIKFVVTHWSAVGQLFRHPKSLVVHDRAGFPPITLFFGGCVAFILSTAAVVAWSRTGFGVEILITSRYKIYSLTLLALLYTYAAATTGSRFRRGVLVGGVAGSVLVAGLSYVSFVDETIWWRHWLTTNQFNFTHSTNRPVTTLDPVSERYTRPAPAFYEAGLPVVYGPARQPVVGLSLKKTLVGYAVTNTNVPALGLRDEGAYLLARSDKRTYLFPVWQNQRSVRQARFLPANLFTTGFRADILTAELDAGTYNLFVLTVSDTNAHELYPTNQVITSVGQPIDTTQKNW